MGVVAASLADGSWQLPQYQTIILNLVMEYSIKLPYIYHKTN